MISDITSNRNDHVVDCLVVGKDDLIGAESSVTDCLGGMAMESNTQVLMTEARLQRAFIKLMAQEGFDRLTVQKLTRIAGINRGTFYLHYLDKFDLLAHYEGELVQQVTEIFQRYTKPVRVTDTSPTRDAFWQFFQYAYRQRALLITLLQSPASSLMTQTKAVINQVVGVPLTKKMPTDFAQELISQGILDFIIFWLTRPEVLAPRAAYTIFVQSRTLSPQQLLTE